MSWQVLGCIWIFIFTARWIKKMRFARIVFRGGCGEIFVSICVWGWCAYLWAFCRPGVQANLHRKLFCEFMSGGTETWSESGSGQHWGQPRQRVGMRIVEGSKIENEKNKITFEGNPRAQRNPKSIQG